MKRLICLVSSVTLALALSACGSSHHTTTAVVVTKAPAKRPGPPPHAPAHGYRYRHGDVDMIYDAGLGVYVVVHTQNRYYYKGHYYCRRGTRWVAADRLSGPWTVAVARDFPLVGGKDHGKVMKAEKGKKGKKKQKGVAVN